MESGLSTRTHPFRLSWLFHNYVYFLAARFWHSFGIARADIGRAGRHAGLRTGSFWLIDAVVKGTGEKLEGHRLGT